MKNLLFIKRNVLRFLPALLLTIGFAMAETTITEGRLPKENFTVKSLFEINLGNHSARLPLHRGTFRGRNYWYILTDVSNQELAIKLGLNFAPKLANAGRGCSGCVQVLDIPPDITNVVPEFNGVPDFSPSRLLIPSENSNPFPPAAAVPGAFALPGYSPYVQARGTNVVYNATIVAEGNGPFDVTKHSNTHDRLLAIDTAAMTADLLIVRAFSGGKEIIYLGLESSSPETAVIERATLVPALGDISFPNGAFRQDGARAAIFTFANGQTGRGNPRAQGLNHAIIDGMAAVDASLANRQVIDALRNGGDARAALEVFPTMLDPKFRFEYSPAWDAHLTFWSDEAVATGRNVAQTDAFTVRLLGTRWILGSAGGHTLRSAGFELNCPVLGFVKDPPLRPLIQSPIRLPLSHHDLLKLEKE
ncbi:MAG TPA: hypothetical protein VNJ01_13990 [Bacteriovoracaceae bacterium]|nr:hypothetical protein [Bacteriovoracaceae bacterium]